MSASSPGYRVGLAGASSLLGQEILRVLKERGLAISRLSTFPRGWISKPATKNPRRAVWTF